MQKKIPRTCEKCGEEKRTTIDIIEAPVYYCEDCQKEAGLPVLKGGVGKGAWLVIIVGVVMFIFGYIGGLLS